MTAETVYVVATTDIGTTHALREAHRRAQSSGASISLLVAHVTSLDPKTGPQYDAVAHIDEFDALAASAGVPVTTYACICKQARDLAAWFDVDRSTILVGGHRGSWWRPTPERRLARALARERRRVVFVDAGL